MRSIERLAEYGADWRFFFKHDGGVKTVARIARELAGVVWWHAEFLLLTRQLQGVCPSFIPKLALTIRAFREEDIGSVRRARCPSEAQVCSKRMARGQFGLVALHDGQFAGYTWTCPRIDPDLERVVIPLGVHDIYATDDYTVPALRGRGVQTALLVERHRQCLAQGYQRVMVYVEKQNRASLRAYTKTGYAVTGQFHYLRLGNWRRVQWGAGGAEWQGGAC